MFPRRRTCAALGALLCAIGSGGRAVAHDGHTFGNPFHEATVSAAADLATTEHKLVFVYVTAPGRPAPEFLETPSWKDWRALDLLILETVAVRMNADTLSQQLPGFDVDLEELPLVLLLDTQGRVLHSFAGDLDAEQLDAELHTRLRGAAALERARQVAAGASREDPIGFERLAATLARNGQIAEALAEYRRCVDVGLVHNTIYAAARRRFVFKELVALAKEHDLARRMLADLKRDMQETLLKKRDNPNVARNLAELNFCLGQPADTLEFYDRLPERSRARQVLFDWVIEQLVDRRRYEEVLAMVEPQQAFRQEVIMARGRRFKCAETPDMRHERGTKAFAVARGALLVEALVATGQAAEAQQLARQVLRFRDDDVTRGLLREHLRRADGVAGEELLSALGLNPTSRTVRDGQ